MKPIRTLLALAAILSCGNALAGLMSVAGGHTVAAGGGGSCPNAIYTPGGSDGQGGCFPYEGNTGPSGSLTTYSGSCTFSTPNTTITSKILNCDIFVNADNIVFTNSEIHGTIGSTEGVSYRFSIIDSFVEARPPGSAAAWESLKAIEGQYITILRSEITRGTGVVFCWHDCDIRDSYLHVVSLDDPNATDHASVLRIHYNNVIQHNSLHCDYTGPFLNNDIGCSADMTMYPQFSTVNDNVIYNNLFMANEIGNAYCAYGGNSGFGPPYQTDPVNGTNITWDKNVFQRGGVGAGHICGDFGPIGDYPNLPDKTGSHFSSDNIFDDGVTIDPRAY